jgi:long-chain acyl-CoA synthetase
VEAGTPSAAAPCPPEVKRQLIEWWGPVIHEFYGATEGAGCGTGINSEEWLRKPGSVGKPLPTCELVIDDEQGTRLDTRQVGQIYFKSLLGTDFEYHNAPEKTAESHLEPAVFTYGDVGYVDPDGYLFLSDRKIDMIISGGVNIYPAEIESVLITTRTWPTWPFSASPTRSSGKRSRRWCSPPPGQCPARSSPGSSPRSVGST